MPGDQPARDGEQKKYWGSTENPVGTGHPRSQTVDRAWRGPAAQINQRGFPAERKRKYQDRKVRVVPWTRFAPTLGKERVDRPVIRRGRGGQHSRRRHVQKTRYRARG